MTTNDQCGFSLIIDGRKIGDFEFAYNIFPSHIENFAALASTYQDQGYDWDEGCPPNPRFQKVIELDGDHGILRGMISPVLGGIIPAWELYLPRATILEILQKGQQTWWPYCVTDDE